MKFLKIFFLTIGITVLVLIAGIVIFVKTFDVNRYKPQIIAQAKAALNRDVDFQKAELGVSLASGVRLKVMGVRIGEDPDFQKGDFLSIKEISLGIDASEALFHKKISIPAILLESPSVTVIRNKDGGLNALTLAKAVSAGAPSAAVAGQPAPAPAHPEALPALLISSLKLNNGDVTYLDHSFDPPLSLKVSSLGVSISDFSLTRPFAFVVEGAVLSSGKNVNVEGTVQLDMKTGGATVSGLKVNMDLSTLLLEKIPAAFPMVKADVLPANLTGKVACDVAKLSAGPQGLSGLEADVSVAQGGLQLKGLASPIKDIQADIRITASKIDIAKASAGIAEGTIKIAGSLADYLAGQDFDAAIDIQNVKIQDLAQAGQGSAAPGAEGSVSGALKMRGKGFTSAALTSSLSGDGKISVKSAKLKNINVLRMVLDKLSAIPVLSGLSGQLEAGLPERYKQKLTQTDTALADFELPVTIVDGKVLIRDAALTADEFIFKGQIEVGFDGSYALEGSFLIPQELAAAMVTTVPPLQYLLNEDKQIYVPLKVSGRAAETRFDVDATYIVQRLAMNQAKMQLMKVINKAVGGQDATGASAAGAEGQGAPQTGSQNASAAQDIVNGIFGSIFKQ